MYHHISPYISELWLYPVTHGTCGRWTPCWRSSCGRCVRIKPQRIAIGHAAVGRTMANQKPRLIMVDVKSSVYTKVI